MNGTVAILLACAVAAQWLLPRRLLALPLLAVFAWIPREQTIELGDLKVTALRIIIVVALARIVARRERPAQGVFAMDWLWLAWSAAMLATWTWHTSNDLAYRAGLVWDYLGSYAVLRVALSDFDDVERLFAWLAIVLVPVGVLMLVERHAGANPFGDWGGLPTQWREGKFRAAGPFAHPILAGTVGAGCLLTSLALWRARPMASRLGIFAGGAIVYASASSGPVMMTGIGLLGMASWRWRAHVNRIRWALLALLLALQIVMQDPVYFLMAKIDVVGGSTGWHRARLIQEAIEHLDEWWAAGTDYTRHWMPTGIPANDQHTDITNQFLGFGVMGGLPLMVPFVLAIVVLLRRVDAEAQRDGRHAFLAWTVGAVMLAHAANFFSALLFDQSIVSFMLLFACAGVMARRPAPVPQPAFVPDLA